MRPPERCGIGGARLHRECLTESATEAVVIAVVVPEGKRTVVGSSGNDSRDKTIGGRVESPAGEVTLLKPGIDDDGSGGWCGNDSRDLVDGVGCCCALARVGTQDPCTLHAAVDGRGCVRRPKISGEAR